MKLAKEIESDETTGLVHQPRTDEGQLRFLADAGQGRADGRVPGRAESHPDGDQAFAKGDMIRARPEYEEGLRGWRKVLDDPEFHALVDDVSLGGDLVDVIRRYQKCLDQDDQDLPDPFILQDVIDKQGSRQGSPLPPVRRARRPSRSLRRGERPSKKAPPSQG